jgi:hypothetical protein
MRNARRYSGRKIAGALSAALALGLSGCTGTGYSPPAPQGPVGSTETGTFFAASQPLGNGTARGFVTLNRGVPVAIGWEMTEAALTGLPTLGFDVPLVQFYPLPPQASVTPFKNIFLIWFDAHGPVGIGDVPHFHPLLLRLPPQPPTNPPKENLPVAAEEIPQDHGQFSGAIVPGVGAGWDDPDEPPAKPGWNSTGYNYLFYNGHMNGVSHGATNGFLASKQTRSGVIKQPQVYPEPGLYPHRHTVRWDDTRKVWIFSWEDWRPAAVSRKPGTT